MPESNCPTKIASVKIKEKWNYLVLGMSSSESANVQFQEIKLRRRRESLSVRRYKVNRRASQAWENPWLYYI